MKMQEDDKVEEPSKEETGGYYYLMTFKQKTTIAHSAVMCLLCVCHAILAINEIIISFQAI